MVTGTNGDIGKALVKALLDRGAAKIDAAVKTATVGCIPGHVTDRVISVQLDITVASEVSAAVEQCGDVDVLINCAGIKGGMAPTSGTGMDAARELMEVNFFGTLNMCLAFAPVLASRGGGVIVNVCSVIGLVNLPLNGIHRAALAARNIRVVRAYPVPVGAPITAGTPPRKATPAQVADAILTGAEKGRVDIPVVSISQDVHADNYSCRFERDYGS